MSDANRPRGLSLAWKLLFSFLTVAFVSIGTVAIISSQTTAREVRGFVLHGEQSTYAELLKELEAYYQDHGGWEGVQVVLPGSGQRGQSGRARELRGGAIPCSPMSLERSSSVHPTDRVVSCR